MTTAEMKMPGRTLLGLGVLGAGLYGLLFTLLPLMNSDKQMAQRQAMLGVAGRAARRVWGDAFCDDPRLELTRRFTVIGVFLVLLLVYGLMLWAARGLRPPRAPRLRTLLLFTAVFSVPLVLTDHPFYTDVFSYIVYGRIPGVYHGNPYVDVPAMFPDVFLQGIAEPWRYNSSLYGPVWVGLSYLLTRGVELLGGAPWLYILGYKLIATAAHLACAALVYGLAARLRPGAEVLATVAYAWNPLMLAETAWNCHNDPVLLLGLLLALRLLAADRPAWGLVPLVGSVLVKWVTLVALPLYVLVWMRQSSSLKVRATRLAAAFGLFCLLTAAAFAPFWGGAKTLFEPVQWAWGHGFTNNSLGALALYEYRQARFLRGESPDPAREIERAYAPLIRAFAATGRVDWSLTPPPDTPALERAVRLFTLALLALVWAYWALRVRDLESLVLGVGWSIFAYLTTACLYFWPWYLVTLLGLAALVPHRRLFTAAVVLSLSAWLIYIGDSGWLGPDGRRFRALLAFGPPLLYLCFAAALRRKPVPSPVAPGPAF